jgi:hypothetical protein
MRKRDGQTVARGGSAKIAETMTLLSGALLRGNDRIITLWKVPLGSAVEAEATFAQTHYRRWIFCGVDDRGR